MGESIGTAVASPAVATKTEAPKVSHKAKPKAVVGPITWHTVLEDRTIPRAGSNYELKAGKVINSGEYDIALLKKFGAKLEDAEAPSWWTDAQEASGAK